jgi:dynein intermediate chain, cytosolic
MDEIRAKRAAALEEKRRKLDELKARRSTRSSTVASSSGTTSKSAGNLDDYIDDLLNSAPPPPPPSISVTTLPPTTTPVRQEAVLSPKETSPSKQTISASVVTRTELEQSQSQQQQQQQQPPAKKVVETFTIAIQTEEDDFPEKQLEEKTDEIIMTEDMPLEASHELVKSKETNAMAKEPSLLPEEQMEEAISTESFTHFFNSASKKVERLLGAPILSDLLVGDEDYYTDKESKRDSSSVRGKEGSLVSAQVSFSFPKWTQHRDITSIDWSPHHRGELMLASYHIPSTSKSAMGETAVSSMKPHETYSSSLLPRSKTEMTNADGLTIVWNLSMPSRPEHIFTCGSPVLHAKFHPTEGSLVVGACYSGQVVIWDVRNGRLPVQKSSLNITGKDGIGAHVYPVVGMEVLDVRFIFVFFASSFPINVIYLTMALYQTVWICYCKYRWYS